MIPLGIGVTVFPGRMGAARSRAHSSNGGITITKILCAVYHKTAPIAITTCTVYFHGKPRGLLQFCPVSPVLLQFAALLSAKATPHKDRLAAACGSCLSLSAISPQNPRQYIQYCLWFFGDLTKIIRRNTTHALCAVLP